MSKIDDALLKFRAMGYAEEAHAGAVEVDRLRAALKPFAELALRISHMSGESAALVSVANLRAALKALGEEV